MDYHLLVDNLTNPALLFFFLGILAVQLKSDLSIPENSSKFISLYLLFSIGFKGGQELAHSHLDVEMISLFCFGICLALIVPIYTFFLLKHKLGIYNAAAIAASYGSVSAVTFITAVSFLDMQGQSYGGHMVAVMAFMEAPSIVVGVFLLSFFRKDREKSCSFPDILHHSFTNGSVLLILGSLLIGYLANEQQAQGIAPFTTDIFKGFLAVFLLDMGISSGRTLSSFWKNGPFPFTFAILLPLFNGIMVAYLSGFFITSPGDRLLLSILGAGASYIAVPAAMKMAAPQADPGLYIPMALAVTFPFNITLGMPLYMHLISIW